MGNVLLVFLLVALCIVTGKLVILLKAEERVKKSR